MKILCCFAFLLLFISAHAQNDPYIDSVLQHRHEKDAEFRDTSRSPLGIKEMAVFTGLYYFDVDTSFHVQAVFHKYKKQRSFTMKTSTDRLPVYQVYGYLEFSLQGKNFTLQVYRNKEIARRPGLKDYLFIPFTDLTNGEESYGGGRYIDFRIPEEETVWLDFNEAYNPYCAYNTRFSCPVPPAENFLDTRITAGEKNFGDH